MCAKTFDPEENPLKQCNRLGLQSWSSEYVRQAESLRLRLCQRWLCSCYWQRRVQCHIITRSAHAGMRFSCTRSIRERRLPNRCLSCRRVVSAFAKEFRMHQLVGLAHQSGPFLVHRALRCYNMPKYRPCGKCPSRTTTASNFMSTPYTVIAMGTGAIALTFCIWASLVSSFLVKFGNSLKAIVRLVLRQKSSFSCASVRLGRVLRSADNSK